MISEQIRIKENVKTQLDNLMPDYVKKVFNDGKDKKKIRKMRRYGLSYNDFIQVLINKFCE